MEKKWDRALLFSGGGTRIMIYLGIYAALEELDKKPDVLLATCGGAMAATVINTFPDSLSRKNYLKSEEYFNFVKSLVLTEERKLKNIGLFSLKKILNKKNAPQIEDVFYKYLVEMPQDLSEVLPSLKDVKFSTEIPTVIIGSELLFTPADINKKRNGKKLYRRLIITDPKTANRIDLKSIEQKSLNHTESVVAQDSIFKTDISMLMASRISASDMFYMSPVLLGNSYFAGGAIDLIPVEIGQNLADEIIIEKKQTYSGVEEAFVLAVLGYSGNKRLAEINDLNIKYQIDTNDIKERLNGHFIAKKIDWKTFEIKLTIPDTIKKFQNDMDLQWKYGYEKTMESFGNQFNSINI